MEEAELELTAGLFPRGFFEPDDRRDRAGLQLDDIVKVQNHEAGLAGYDLFATFFDRGSRGFVHRSQEGYDQEILFNRDEVIELRRL